jgi:hypothetical protein
MKNFASKKQGKKLGKKMIPQFFFSLEIFFSFFFRGKKKAGQKNQPRSQKKK